MGCGIYLIAGFVVGIVTWFAVLTVRRMVVLEGIDEVRKKSEAKNNEIKKAVKNIKESREVPQEKQV